MSGAPKGAHDDVTIRKSSTCRETRTLPGVELIADAQSLTHAITIERPRSDVWSWLVQMGAAGPDGIAMTGSTTAPQQASTELFPSFRRSPSGMCFPAMTGVTEGFVVLGFHAGRYLILGWPSSAGTQPITTWAFLLEEPSPGRTRLIVRVRGGNSYRPPFGLPRLTA